MTIDLADTLRLGVERQLHRAKRDLRSTQADLNRLRLLVLNRTVTANRLRGVKPKIGWGAV